MSNLFLVGFMGAGKSVLGRKLAARLHLRFVDLDAYIEETTQQSIPSLFQSQGEEGFRLIERDCLHRLAQSTGMVVSTGGGTPCHHGNMEWMNAHGITLYLNVSQEELLRRLDTPASKAKRPLISQLDTDELRLTIASMLASRLPYYQQASHIIDIDRHHISQTLTHVTNVLGESFPYREAQSLRSRLR